MSIEKAVDFFRIKATQDPKAHPNWESVLSALKKDNPNDGNFYLICQNKGTEKETRSRFLTHREALETVIYIIEKNKIK